MMKMDKQALFMLSLCQKAGKAVTGEDSCVRAISSGRGTLVIIAEDASDNTKKKFTNKAYHYNIPVATAGTRAELSKSIGKENRPVIVITDKGLSGKIEELLNQRGMNGESR